MANRPFETIIRKMQDLSQEQEVFLAVFLDLESALDEEEEDE